MDLKHLILAVTLSIITTAIGANYHYSKEVAKHKSELEAAQKQISSFCDGHTFGGFRVATVICNDTVELCMCGDPSSINFDKGR